MDSVTEIINNIDKLSVSDALNCDPEECISYVTNPSKQLKIITQNIRSIHANFDSFLTLLQRINLDCEILVLTECWLKRYNDFIPVIDNYSNYQTKKHINQNDGVVIYVKNVEDYTVEEPDISDASCLVLKIGTHKAVICIYRSPSFRDTVNFLESLDALLASLKCYKNIVMVGDINLDIASTSNQISDYLDLVASHGLLPAHSLPTRERACLDHIMLKTNFSALTLVLHAAVTDHNPVILCLKQNRFANSRSRSILKTNYESLDSEMQTTNFQPVYDHTDANEATKSFVTTVARLINTHTSIIAIPSKKRLIKPWMTVGMLRCMRNKDAMHKKLNQSPNNVILAITYKRYRNFCTKILRKLKRDFDRKELSEASKDNKKLWKVIKRVTNTEKSNTSNSDLLDSSTSPQASVDKVNKLFANIAKELAEQFSCLPSSHKIPPDIASTSSLLNSFGMLETDEAEVGDVLMSLKSDSSTGWDNISTQFLKRYSSTVVPLLTHIFNMCFNTGTFPVYFKKAIIHPIYKSGNKKLVNNYRPIAVLPSISKILERLINKRLVTYLEDKKLLSPNQFGFRRNKSTSSAVNDLIDHITRNIDKKKKVLSIFLDLKKAFDTVSIPNLISKLEELGIRGQTLNIFRDYLQNRTQCVKIQNYLSREEPVTFGVPQGSVLGPTLFIIYVNQLCNLNLENGRIVSFADDTVLTFSGDTWDDAFHSAQKGLNIVLQWLKKHILTINTDKTKVLTYSLRNSAQPPNSYALVAHSCLLSGTATCTCPHLERCQTIKYLGVTLDNSLSFAPHIELLSKRVRKLIFVFSNLRHIAESHVIRCTYYALCQSLLTYCICAWGGAPKTVLLRLERAQRAVLKVCTFRPIFFPTEELYMNCKVLSVRQLFVLHLLLYQHKKTSHEIPTTRRKDKVCQPFRCNYSFTRRFPCFQGPHLYNSLNKILDFCSLPKVKFKKKINDWLQTLNYKSTESLLLTQYLSR